MGNVLPTGSPGEYPFGVVPGHPEATATGKQSTSLTGKQAPGYVHGVPALEPSGRVFSREETGLDPSHPGFHCPKCGQDHEGIHFCSDGKKRSVWA